MNSDIGRYSTAFPDISFPTGIIPVSAWSDISHDRVAGFLGLEKARVRYFLSINGDNLPENAVQGEKRTYRSIQIEGEEFEFSQGFTELHTESYRHILSGEGFGLDEVRNCINIVHTIRNAEPIGLKGDYLSQPKGCFTKGNFASGW